MQTPRIFVVVASLGRPRQIAELHPELERQTLTPRAIIYSVTAESDLPRDVDLGNATVLMGPKGSTTQRNRAIDEVINDCDLFVFFDDDYLPSRFALERIAQFFDHHPDVAAANGVLLADGVTIGGLSYAQAREILERYDADTVPEGRIKGDARGLAGGHLVCRAAAVGAERFDEALPLYGWQEDIDFSNRLLPYGRLVFTDAFAGVHIGVRAGRVSGIRLGYSQIANPVYLKRKGTMSGRYALRLVGRNVTANHLRALYPEPWTDRRGRVRGNWLAILDLLRGRLTPRRIVDF